MSQTIKQVFLTTLKNLLAEIPHPMAWERALNLCLVLGGIRPACLWYLDLTPELSLSILEKIDTDEVGFSIGMGKVEVPVGEKVKSISVPQTLIFRIANKKAVEFAQSQVFDKDMFADHQTMGEVLGYPCAGDDRHSPYHIKITGTTLHGEVFTILEMMCQKKHKAKFQNLTQKIQDFCTKHQLPIDLDLYIATLKDQEP